MTRANRSSWLSGSTASTPERVGETRDVRERLARPDGERRQHGVDVAGEPRLEALQLLGRALLDRDDLDPLGCERGAELALPQLRLAPRQLGDALLDRLERVGRREAVGRAHREAGLGLAHQAGDADLEELVQVVGEDGAELDALEQRRTVSSATRSSTRALNSIHDSSRLRRRDSSVSVRLGIGLFRSCQTSPRRAERVDEEALEVRDQALRFGQQVSVAQHPRPHPQLDALDELPVLGADLVVELEHVGDPLLVGVREEEVVEEAIRAVGAEREHRARSRGCRGRASR